MDRDEIRFHRLAREEYLAARRWYARKGTERVAAAFQNAVDRALDRISDHSQTLPIYRNEFRYVRVKRFPYVLVFHIADDASVVVIAVAHTSRRTAYWRRRKRS